jgi:hypothetical protein
MTVHLVISLKSFQIPSSDARKSGWLFDGVYALISQPMVTFVTSVTIIRLLQDEIQYEKSLWASIVYYQHVVFEWIEQTLPNPLSEIEIEASL